MFETEILQIGNFQTKVHFNQPNTKDIEDELMLDKPQSNKINSSIPKYAIQKKDKNNSHIPLQNLL